MRAWLLATALFVASCGGQERGPTPSVLATVGTVETLAIDGGYVYWVADERRALRRVRVSGGAVDELYRAQAAISKIAVGGDRVVFGLATGYMGRHPDRPDMLMEVSLANRNARAIADAGGTVRSIVLDGDDVYWSSYTPGYGGEISSYGGIHRLSAGREQTLMGAKRPCAIAVSATHVYAADAELARVPKTGGPVEKLGPMLSAPYAHQGSNAAAADGQRFYWSAVAESSGRFAGYSVALGGGPATTLADIGGPQESVELLEIALGGDRVWFVTSEGDLWYVPASGDGSPVKHVRAYEYDYTVWLGEAHVAVDGSSVVWTDGQRILRVPR